jgi:hypothetical protein
MLDLLVVAYVQFVIMLIEFKKVLSVQVTLHANNLKQGVFICVARLPQSSRNGLYKELWM